ncbi:MAG TPA: hypothetical protein VN962_06540 [Polyangia bacterium]|nr:hypothetical protein [Polyangia bacterium]
MIKKLAVPALVLAMAGFGCSSSTTNTTTGSGGTAGHSTGGSSTGGSSTGGSSVAGSSGGGHPGGGSSVAGTSGGGTSGGGTSGGGHAGGGTSGGGHAGGGASGGGTSGGGTSGGGHAGGGTSGGGAGGAGVQVMANCNTTDSAQTMALAPEVFCANLIANCPNLPSNYATADMCKTTFMGGAAAKQNCQSYHLCWGVEGKTNPAGPDPTTHCPHAIGTALCTQTQ